MGLVYFLNPALAVLSIIIWTADAALLGTMLPTPGTLRASKHAHSELQGASVAAVPHTPFLPSSTHLCSWGSSVSSVSSSSSLLQQFWGRWQPTCPRLRVPGDPVLGCWAGCPRSLSLYAKRLPRLPCYGPGCLLLFAWLAVGLPWLLCPETCAEQILSSGSERPAHRSVALKTPLPWTRLAQQPALPRAM